MAVEVTDLVDVVLVEGIPVERIGEDVIESDRLSELDTGLLALEVTCRILTMAPCDHVEGAQSLAARTKEMEAKRMTRARDLSDEAISANNLHWQCKISEKQIGREKEIDAGRDEKRTGMRACVEGEGVGHER